ncbi:hypothetical protein [Pelagibius marinus]|uniref:hypothetical protein n=1 Tax=Pelagibius marinus TaxID=2762760 RepID=UPI00187328FA|nr:hypothetical protein [Pelagibius marinus]
MSLLAEMIEDFIRSKGATKKWFAEEIGTTQNTVTRWLKDESWPNLYINQIKEILDLSDAQMLEIANNWRESSSQKKSYRLAGTDYISRRYNGAYESFVKDLFLVEKDAIKGVDEDFMGEEVRWAPFFRAVPDFWRVILRRDKIVGGWQFVPLQAKYIEEIKSGNLVDSELHIKMINPTNTPGHYSIYFPAVVINPNENNVATRRLIRDSIFQTIRENANDGIYFSEVVAIASSEEGKLLCNISVGMECLRVHPRERNSEIYLLRGVDVPSSALGKDLTIRQAYLNEFRKLP